MEHNSCCFRFEYPFPHEELGPECQFIHETEFFDCGGEGYCGFHLPIADDDGNPSEKYAWITESKDGPKLSNFRERIDSILSAQYEDEEIPNLTGVVFPSDMDFGEKELPGGLWYGVIFCNSASFIGTRFRNDAIFSKAQFLGTCSFADCEFRGAALFANAIFCEHTFFLNVKANSIFLFSESEFLMSSHFSGINLQNVGTFDRVKFGPYSDFTFAEFNEQASFSDARFQGQANFTKSKFQGGVSFRNADFDDYVSFVDTEFLGDANFRGAKFHENAYFIHTRERMRIYNQEFSGNTEESREANSSSYEDGPPLSESFFELDFRDGFVKGTVEFTNRIFNLSAKFSNREFWCAPMFGGCQLHEDTRWDGTCFLDRGSEHAPDAYRILRFAMERTRNRHQEGVFFALEQESKRNNMKRKSLDWWLSLAYEITAGYGRSLSRPLGSLVITTLLFCFLYGYPYWLSEMLVPTPSKLASFIQPTIEQVVRPFAVWIRPGPAVEDLFGSALFTFQILATIQSILSLTFIALFILALRWHFKRG